MSEYHPIKVLLGGKSKERFFREDEANYLYLTDPDFFLALLESGKTKLPFGADYLRGYCLNLLQDKFHIILRRYLKIEENLFFKLCCDELEIFKIARKILGFEEWPSGLTPSQTMIFLYQELEKLAPAGGERQNLSILTGSKIKDRLSEEKWQREVIDSIRLYTEKNLKPWLERVVLQGSFATADPVYGWSDLDIIVFLKKETFDSVESLLEFKKRIGKISLLVFRIDDLAHHEFMFFTDFDRRNYPSLIFPPVLYSYTETLLGNKTISVFPREEFVKGVAPAMRIVQYFRQKIELKKISTDLFSWKNDLSLIMLFPSILLEACGVEVYKKFSFQKAKELFPGLDFSVIDKVSSIRQTWRRTNGLQFLPNGFFLLIPVDWGRKIVELCRRVFTKERLGERGARERQAIYQDFLLLAERSVGLILESSND